MPKSWYTTFQQSLRKFGEGRTGDLKILRRSTWNDPLIKPNQKKDCF